jgi:hypothetical protein
MIAPFEHEMALLVTIPGVERVSSQEIIAEIGADMTASTHSTSPPGLECAPDTTSLPANAALARPVPAPSGCTARSRESAKAAARTKDTYLGAQYARLRGRHGRAKATTAVGHSILVAAYHMVNDSVPYSELGPDWFGRLRPEQHARRLAGQIELLGYNITITPAA